MARRTHCPDGRVLYRAGEIPPDLATVTMLRLQRRRPAPGQRPAATLLYAGNEYTGLYKISDTELMPALSPGQRVAYEARRQCARCSARRETPWPGDPLSGRRVCEPCGEAEAEAAWRAWQLRARAAAVAWAGEVLADPSAVLLHLRSHGGGSLLGAVQVVELATGAVVLDAPRLRHNERDFDLSGGRWRPESWTDDGDQSIRDIADEVRALVGRRLVAWSGHHYGPHGLIWNMRTLLNEDLEESLVVAKRPMRWSPGTAGDELGDWYSDWLGMPQFHGRQSWVVHDLGVRHQELPGPAAPPDVPAEVDHMLTLLRCMAVDDHPAGRPRCPQLLDGTREVCGSGDVWPDTGLCSSCTAAGAVR